MAYAESYFVASFPPIISYPNLYACLVDASRDQRLILTKTSHRNENKLNKPGRIFAMASNPQRPRRGDTIICTTGCEYAHDRACYRSAAQVRSTS